MKTWKDVEKEAEQTPILEVNGVKLSKLIWWLAEAMVHAKKIKHEEIKVGDWVIEISHLIGTRGGLVGKLDAVGKVTKIVKETEPHLLGGTVYTICTLENKEVTWSNAMFEKLDLN